MPLSRRMRNNVKDFDAKTQDSDKKTEFWNDAEVVGDLTTPESRAVLGSRIAYMSALSTRTPGSEWRPDESEVQEFLDEILTRQPETDEKDGKTLCYATAPIRVGNDRDTLEEVRRTYRIKNMMESVTVIAIDVDGTAKVEDVRDRLAKLGWFSVVYTTHSHAEKSTPEGDRFRIIIFLTEPFRFPAWKKDWTVEDLKAHKAALDEYAAFYVGVCDMLGLNEVDGSALSPNQMMYPPRRPKDAEYKHYVVAGKALDLSTVTPGDASKYMKGKGGTGNTSAKVGTETAPPILSDGFNVADWWEDGGRYLPIEAVLDTIGWEDRGPAGGGRNIMCLNDANHSNPGDPSDTGTWACENDEDFVIMCHHDHCRHLTTWDMLRLIEENILAEVAVLPDEYATFSDLLCDSDLYPIVDGEELFFDKYDYGVSIPIDRLTTAKKVEKAFAALPADAGRDRIAALYAGVEAGGGKGPASDKLKELVKGLGSLDGNDLKALKSAGSEMLKAQRKEWGTRQREAGIEEVIEAMGNEDLGNPSMDPADPLGDTPTEMMATMGRRFAPIDLDGKFKIVRKPDLGSFHSELMSTVVIYGKHDFLDLHLDRQIKIKGPMGDEHINPAKLFLETAKRKSGMGLIPPPLECPENYFNLYQGRKLQSKPGSWRTLRRFILKVICKGDRKKYRWLILWMAHMVQRPGEKPGTAVICRGEGGTGKGSFGQLLSKLAAPHFKQLEKQVHVVGQFAGEHLSKCILAVVNEAVFGKDPKVASELKALVDSTTIQAEVKGMSVVTLPSFLRLYIDSNAKVPLLIEGNGSERRYFVLETSDDHQRDDAYFTALHAAINGDEMAAMLDYLEKYDPVSAGFTWNDVRDAPATAERDAMANYSMSAPMRRLGDVLADGAVTLMVDGFHETFKADDNGLRVPQTAFKDYICAVGDKRNAEDSDVPAMFKRLHPEAELTDGRGVVGGQKNARWWQFPGHVIGVERSEAA